MPIRNDDRRESRGPATIEQLESRQFLSASLGVQNLDVLPGFERLIFNRIRTPNADIPNDTKERGTLKLTNSGDQTLKLSGVKVTGPFRVLGLMPTSIPAGKSVNVTVQFTASKLPTFTYNQTAGFDNANKGGVWAGTLSFTTNDPANPTYSEALSGWFQMESEKNEEPGLQTIVNLMSDYKTNIAPANTVHLTQPQSTPQYYGEEVASAYWTAADSSKSVSIRQLATFHTQGNDVVTGWFKKGQGASTIFTTDGKAGQSFMPYKKGQPTVPAAGSFAAGSSTFGIKIDQEWSDDKLNTKNPAGGGHHVRFYPVRDHFGNPVANAYFVTMDYSIIVTGAAQNYDFQDNVYILFNVKPAGN